MSCGCIHCVVGSGSVEQFTFIKYLGSFRHGEVKTFFWGKFFNNFRVSFELWEYYPRKLPPRKCPFVILTSRKVGVKSHEIRPASGILPEIHDHFIKSQ